MSHSYKPVLWNRTKLIYDAFLLTGVVAYLWVYLILAPTVSSSVAAVDVPIQQMRAFGSCAFLLLTIVLAIGPLARIDTRFLPLLYNRRHFGVITAIVSVTHAVAVLDWYFAFSKYSQAQAFLIANTSFRQLAGFPFEWFGMFALLVMVIMAATSHDFWLSVLTPRIWKTLHMSVYAAYAAAVIHVAIGPLSTSGNPVMAVTVTGGAVMLATLHLLAGRREVTADRGFGAQQNDGWVLIGDLHDFTEGRALIGAGAGGERIAVFKFKGKLSALSNVCSHQGGPVGEGKVVLGLVTCPWHGYQYRAEDGCSPPPFKERIRKYRVRLQGSAVWVDPVALPLGTVVPPFPIPEGVAP